MSGFKGGRGGRRGGNANPKGSFLNGVWHCDCSPPLPAVHFPVKKAGPNKGRWFRTCQNKTCDFFLWDTDASPRELAALSNNSRSEPGRVHPVTPSRPRPQKPSPPPPYTSEAVPSASSRKRSRQRLQDDDDEFDMGENAAFDEELDQVMTAIETPSKKARTDLLTTPVTTPARRKLPWQKDGTPKANMLHTPHTEQHHTRDVFKTPSVAPGSSFVASSNSKQSDVPSSQTLTPGSSPVNTPTPSRFKDVGTSGADSELAQDVFGTLQEANVILTDQMRRNLTMALSKHAVVAEGIKKGRDAARASIKAKDAKVTELTYRVNTLEAELEAERAMVKHLQWKAESGHSSD